MSTQNTILIVDDDPQFRKTLSDILKVKGYVPLAVATGVEALDRIEAETPAVALIDIRLDDISGLDLMKEIKARYPAACFDPGRPPCRRRVDGARTAPGRI